MRRSAFVTMLVCFATGASAQQTPSPDAVNDCTRIPNPRLMQECIERSTGLDNRFLPQPNRATENSKLLEDRGALREESGPPP
ncbi:hypothetical protein M2322_004328 [Rhodoblastus acidophilus]|nr:hypothetical protein [Rhodoblastus acidophilus]